MAVLRSPGVMPRFESHWFYWHTGRKRIALTSMAVSGAVSGLLLTLAAGCSPWTILLAVLFDTAGVFLALLYVLVLRWSIPDGFTVQAYTDTLVLDWLLLPAVIGFLLNRGCTFIVARTFGERGDRGR